MTSERSQPGHEDELRPDLSAPAAHGAIGGGEAPERDANEADDRPWSEADTETLRTFFGEKDEQFLARELRRAPETLRAKAWQIFDAPPKDDPWQPDEIDALKRYLGAIDAGLIGRMIGRSVASIERQLVELSVHLTDEAFSADDLVRFKRLYGTRTDEDLSIVFGRKLEVVRAEAAKLCLSKDKAFLRRTTGGEAKTKMPRWTSEELDRLRELYPVHSNLEIAKALGRSVKSVVSKAHNMRLKKDKARLQQMGRQNVKLRHDR